MYSESFSNNNAPFKNSSLDAKKGLNLILVELLKFLLGFLWYMILEPWYKLSSISVYALKLATLMSFFISASIPDSIFAVWIISSMIWIFGWINCVNSRPIVLLFSIILLTPIPFSSRLLMSFSYLFSLDFCDIFLYSYFFFFLRGLFEYMNLADKNYLFHKKDQQLNSD